MPSRHNLLILLFLALFFIGTPQLLAQNQRWLELSSQAKELYAQGRYAEAVPVAEESLRVASASFAPDDPIVATSLNNLAVLYRQQGRYAEAEDLLQRAVGIREKTLGPGHRDVVSSLNNLALLYQQEGRYAEAEALLQRALGALESPGPETALLSTTLSNLGSLYTSERKYAEAEPLLQRALELREQTLGPEHPNVARSLNNLAVLYGHEGKYSQAEPLIERALDIIRRHLGRSHPDTTVILANLTEVRFAEGLPVVQAVLTDLWAAPAGRVSVNQLRVPGKARDAFHKAQAALRGGNLKKARQQLDAALALDPQYSQALALGAVLQLATGDPEQARVQLEAAIGYEPKDPASYVLLGATYNLLQRHDDALRASDRGVALAPNSWPGYFEAGIALLGKGDFPAALRRFDQAQSLAPDDLPLFHLAKARAWKGLQDPLEEEVEMEAYRKQAGTKSGKRSDQRDLVGAPAFLNSDGK